MKKQLLLFLPILIICSLSLLMVANAQSSPTVTINTSHSTIQQSKDAQQIEFIIKLSNKSPVAKDISGVDFVLCSSSPYLVLDSKPIELTDAFDYESKTGSAANPNTLEGMLYQELSTSSVTYKDSKFTALKIKGTAPASVAHDEFVLMRINATLSADAPAGTYTVTAKDFTASDLNGKAIITNDFACSVEVKENKTSVGETYTTYSLTLQGKTVDDQGGDIGINLRMQLTDELLKDKDAYLKVDFKGKTTRVSLSSLSYNSSTGLYTLTTPVAASAMTYPITVQMFNGNGEYGSPLTYSVKGYCDLAINSYSEQRPTLAALSKAMLNYGAAAQLYFNVNTNNLANANLSNAEGFDAVNAIKKLEGISDVVFIGTAENIGITAHTAALVLGSETKIKHIVTLADGQNINNYTFTANGKTLTPILEDNRYAIYIDGISASSLDKGYTLSITRISDSKVYAITYSALNYAQIAIDAAEQNPRYDKLATVGKALYLYNNAAKEYFKK